MSSIKGPSPSKSSYDGSPLRVAIVHSRWNSEVIDALVKGCREKLLALGVKESQIVVESVPGSWELPLACSKYVFIQRSYAFRMILKCYACVFVRVISGSRTQAGATATDLLGGLSSLGGLGSPLSRSSTPAPISAQMPAQPFDAVIAIGVLIKGSTMHFEYICESVSHGLMRVQLDAGVPVIFGVLTALTDDQALERAGIGRGATKGHNHGEDWAIAAVEMAAHSTRWAEGKF